METNFILMTGQLIDHLIPSYRRKPLLVVSCYAVYFKNNLKKDQQLLIEATKDNYLTDSDPDSLQAYEELNGSISPVEIKSTSFEVFESREDLQSAVDHYKAEGYKFIYIP